MRKKTDARLCELIPAARGSQERGSPSTQFLISRLHTVTFPFRFDRNKNSVNPPSTFKSSDCSEQGSMGDSPENEVTRERREENNVTERHRAACIYSSIFRAQYFVKRIVPLEKIVQRALSFPFFELEHIPTRQT